MVNGTTTVYHLHRLLLAKSEVFQTMMLGQHWSDAKKSQIHLEEPDFCLDHMDSFFR